MEEFIHTFITSPFLLELNVSPVSVYAESSSQDCNGWSEEKATSDVASLVLCLLQNHLLQICSSFLKYTYIDCSYNPGILTPNEPVCNPPSLSEPVLIPKNLSHIYVMFLFLLFPLLFVLIVMVLEKVII